MILEIASTLYRIAEPALPYSLIFISFFLILRTKETMKNLIVFLLAGFLGYATLNLPIEQPLFPLLTGLFLLPCLRTPSSIIKKLTRYLKKIKHAKVAKISKLAAKNINKINYKTLSIAIIGILVLLNIILTNYLGIIVLVTATALGLFTILSKARRINLMGALLIPTILFYLTL